MINITPIPVRNKPSAIFLRLKQYRDLLKEIDEFTAWESRHSNKLSKSWMSYCDVIKFISYQEYCIRFYDGTLEDVRKNSYYKTFK